MKIKENDEKKIGNCMNSKEEKFTSEKLNSH